MSSLRPILSKSMIITSKAASLSCSTGNVYSNFSSNMGFRLHLKTVLLRFSTFLSPTCNHTFTYGSVKHNVVNTSRVFIAQTQVKTKYSKRFFDNINIRLLVGHFSLACQMLRTAVYHSLTRITSFIRITYSYIFLF